MPRRKALDRYPLEYSETFRKASAKELHIACDTVEQAKTLRADLYNFRQALYSHPEKKELAAKAMNVRIILTDATLTLEPIIPPKRKES